MANRDDLVQALAQLDPTTFEDVITSAYRQRHDSSGVASQAAPDPPKTPEEFAHWLATRHLSSDAAIERVVYLPTGSPDGEIRLLEVNRFLNPPDLDVVEPLDFSPDTGLPFKVFVADVTADQWERIKQDPGSILPTGWELEDNRIITRG
jgi:hypothetical protein